MIVFINSCNQLILVMEKCCIFFDVTTEIIIWWIYCFKGLKNYNIHLMVMIYDMLKSSLVILFFQWRRLGQTQLFGNLLRIGCWNRGILVSQGTPSFQSHSDQSCFLDSPSWTTSPPCTTHRNKPWTTDLLVIYFLK